MADAAAADLVGEPVPVAVQRLPAERTPCTLPNGIAAEVVVVRDAAAQSAREERLLRLASRDGLTGLLNRRAFMRRLAEEVAVVGAEGRPLGLVILDLDHFKAVNDRHGHPAGDRVLREAARRLTRTARTVDSVARYGGEEFAWLLPDATPAETLAAGHRLSAALRDRPYTEDRLPLTASIGVCDLASSGSADLLLERADAALYWAKAAGRDAVLTWSPDAERRVAAVAAVSADRRLAMLVTLADEADTTAGAGHGRRVADLAIALAERLGWAPSQLARLHQAALLHDVGKALLPTGLLAKPAPLDAVESAHVRQHAAVGAALASPVLDGEQRAWVRAHHERHDGRGYPDALAGDDIPLGARLIAIADTWDAMTHDRPHQRATGHETALAAMHRSAGTQLMPGSAELLREALRWWSGD